MSKSDIGEIRYERDPERPYRMSEERMAALRAMTDKDIDYSDIPPQDGPPTRRVVGPRFQWPQDVVPVDSDLVDFFKATGDAPASRINAVLREYVETRRKGA